MQPAERLSRFSRRVEEMHGLAIFEGENFSSSFGLNWSKASGLLTLTSRQPDEDQFRSLLMALRPFISEGDRLFYLNGIFNQCQKSIRSEILRGYLVEARERWIHTLRKGYIGLVWNEKAIPPEKVADLWINGYYFHDDPAKRDFLESLGLWEPWVIRMHFVNFVTDVTRMVCYVGHVVRVALKEGQIEDSARG